MPGEKATVVVCTRDRPRQLEFCLASLAAQRRPPHEILIVDSAPQRPARDASRRWATSYLIEHVAGVSRARNAGLRAARGDIVAFIDDDMVAEPDWLHVMVRHFANPVVAAVAGRIRYMKAGSIAGEMSNEDAVAALDRPLRRFNRDLPDWFCLACFGGVCEGGNMAFRRAALFRAGSFDERIGRGQLLNGGEEHVAMMALIASGHEAVYDPSSVLRHPYPPTPARLEAIELDALRTSIAYLLHLWVEHADHREDLMRFILRALRKRATRLVAPMERAYGLPIWRSIPAALGGLALYSRATREWRKKPLPGIARVENVTTTAATLPD